MIYVMSDLHGQYDKYKDMLTQINFSKHDTLYVLGDVLDRGEHGLKILLDMMNRNNIVMILGNHEYMAVQCLPIITQDTTDEFLNSLEEEKLHILQDWLTEGGIHTLKEYKTLTLQQRKQIIDYLYESLLFEEISINDKKFILVHAGLGNYAKDKMLEDYELEELVWSRPDYASQGIDDPDTFIVCGHTPTLTLHGKAKIYHKEQSIVIDCGAYFKEGKLACLCLDTMEEFYI